MTVPSIWRIRCIFLDFWDVIFFNILRGDFSKSELYFYVSGILKKNPSPFFFFLGCIVSFLVHGSILDSHIQIRLGVLPCFSKKKQNLKVNFVDHFSRNRSSPTSYLYSLKMFRDFSEVKYKKKIGRFFFFFRMLVSKKTPRMTPKLPKTDKKWPKMTSKIHQSQNTPFSPWSTAPSKNLIFFLFENGWGVSGHTPPPPRLIFL